MIIGHHILYGKVQDLEKPFVAIEKATSPAAAEEEEEDESDKMEVDGPPAGYRVKAVIRKKILFKTRPKPIIANVPKNI